MKKCDVFFLGLEMWYVTYIKGLNPYDLRLRAFALYRRHELLSKDASPSAPIRIPHCISTKNHKKRAIPQNETAPSQFLYLTY